MIQIKQLQTYIKYLTRLFLIMFIWLFTLTGFTIYNHIQSNQELINQTIINQEGIPLENITIDDFEVIGE